MTIHTASKKYLSQLCLSLLLLSTSPLPAAEKITAGTEERMPIADVHLHYNPSHAEITNTDEALQQLYDNNVQFAVISSKPPSMALELVEAAGGWIIPFYMPYLEPDRKRDWYFDDRVLPAAREALASGVYRGLGEMHLIVGFAPSLKEPHPVIDGMLDLAREFDVPANIHAEASSHLYFQPLCQRHPDVRIQWAHAGTPARAHNVAMLLRACPNVWVDMSALDHMRYGKKNPIVDDDGYLLPAWLEFVTEFQDRIMIGADPTYVEGNASWEVANSGWKYVTEVLDFHRRWLSALPEPIRKKIALQNAVRFFGRDAERAMRARNSANRN